jgi:hypothetical protein
MRTAFFSLLFSLAAGAASASPALCHEKERDDDASARAEQVIDAEEHILPCGFVESGLLGPSCPDVAFYVSTPSGTLLCRVLLPAVHVERRGSTELEERPTACCSDRVPTSAPAPAFAASAAAAPRPLLQDAASALERTQHPPRALFAEPPPVPS